MRSRYGTPYFVQSAGNALILCWFVSARSGIDKSRRTAFGCGISNERSDLACQLVYQLSLAMA